MIKIRILSIGKNKESWLDEALKDYTERLKRTAKIEWLFVETNAELEKKIEGQTIALDPQGKMVTSEQFSEFLLKEVEKGGSRLTFIIGGAEGLTSSLKKLPLISLSPLTFTHQMARLILAEQIYRAFEIERGSPYHK